MPMLNLRPFNIATVRQIALVSYVGVSFKIVDGKLAGKLLEVARHHSASRKDVEYRQFVFSKPLPNALKAGADEGKKRAFAADICDQLLA